MTTLFLVAYYSEVREVLARLPGLADALPAITIKDGELSIDKPVPYTLTQGTAPDEAHIVFDTNYKITDLHALERYMQQGRIALLITARAAITRDVQKTADQKLQVEDVFDISDLERQPSFTITHAVWHTLAELVKNWGTPALLVIASIMMFLYVFINNFLATVSSAIAVYILDCVARVHLEFSAAMRLAAAFRIPVVILSMLPAAIDIDIPNRILCMLYLIFAMWSVRRYDNSKAV